MIVASLLGFAFVLLYNPIAAVARGEAERLYAAAFGRGESLLKTKNPGLGCGRTAPTAPRSSMRSTS